MIPRNPCYSEASFPWQTVCHVCSSRSTNQVWFIYFKHKNPSNLSSYSLLRILIFSSFLPLQNSLSDIIEHFLIYYRFYFCKIYFPKWDHCVKKLLYFELELLFSDNFPQRALKFTFPPKMQKCAEFPQSLCVWMSSPASLPVCLKMIWCWKFALFVQEQLMYCSEWTSFLRILGVLDFIFLYFASSCLLHEFLLSHLSLS